MGNEHDHKNVFDEIHSMPVNELDGYPHELKDSPAVSALRGRLDYGPLMDLAAALVRQLRYRDALEVYDVVVVLYPDSLEARLKRAVRYVTTLQSEKAIAELLDCRKRGAGLEDINYRLGIAYYYAGDYQKAMDELSEVYPIYDGEMGIATMYWHTLAALRIGADPSLLPRFTEDMEVGHHRAYKFAMKVVSGLLPWEEAMAELPKETADLDYAMMAYGMAVLAQSRGEAALASQLVDTVIPRDSFWIGFGYLAAYNDRKLGRI